MEIKKYPNDGILRVDLDLNKYLIKNKVKFHCIIYFTLYIISHHMPLCAFVSNVKKKKIEILQNELAFLD